MSKTPSEFIISANSYDAGIHQNKDVNDDRMYRAWPSVSSQPPGRSKEAATGLARREEFALALRRKNKELMLKEKRDRLYTNSTPTSPKKETDHHQ